MDAITADRYVRINPRFKLRGWLGQPYALLDSLRAVAHFIPEGVFNTLQLCNGRFCPSDFIFYGPRKKHLEALEHDGVLSFSDEPAHLEPGQEYRYYPNHYLRQVQWSLTGSCNYRCRHCFMSAPHGVLPQPSTEECLRIADQMSECGVQVVKLTGGECLIRDDFLQIIDRLLEGGVQIATILTNGALLTEELLQALEERGVLCGFDVSFDGTGGWHDWLRGVPGAEDAAIRAFELCREHGFPTGAQYVLHRGNVGALRESVRLLGRLGVGSVVVGKVNDEGDARGMRDEILSYDELFDICCAYLPQFLEDGSPVPSITLGGIFTVELGKVGLAVGETDWGESSADRPACGAIRSTMYLGSDGCIMPCIPLSNGGTYTDHFPNIASMTLAEALTDSAYYDLVRATVGDVFEHSPACRECEYRGRCLGGCRAKGVDEDGRADLLGRDPKACMFYKGGYYDRARELVERLEHQQDIPVG